LEKLRMPNPELLGFVHGGGYKKVCVNVLRIQ
jgi:hypothetical protein